MNDSLSVESLLKRDRVVVLAALAALCGLAWAYMIGEARAMIDTGVCACAGMKMSGPDMQAWSAAQLVPLFLMWAEMMVAMMVPSAALMVLTFAAVNRKRREQDRPYVPAGIFQWTPFKHACLSHCRSPLGFLLTDWREGKAGAFLMGLKHGAYCTGCCWVLMALLFVAGVMNIWWVAILAIFVLVEKAAPRGLWIGKIAGALLAAWGVWMLST